jgi:hypothetical protein
MLGICSIKLPGEVWVNKYFLPSLLIKKEIGSSFVSSLDWIILH